MIFKVSTNSETVMSRHLAICLINPRSRPSYWTADFAMPFYSLGRRLKYSMANGALVSVAALVPPEQTLYLSQLKDEGILFYYRRTARRLESFAQLPSSAAPVYCLLDNSEWRDWQLSRTTVVVERMRDEQGDPILLVQVTDN